MRIPLSILQLGLVALSCTAFPLLARAADDPVLVQLANGASVRAALDGRTDGDILWLTTSLVGGSLSQSIPWEEVRQVEIGGERFDGSVVRAAVATIRDVSPVNQPDPIPGFLALPDAERLGAVDRSLDEDTVLDRGGASLAPKVQAITISAWLANWDQDVAVDGLGVELTAYDSLGNPISCNGTVNFVLQAWKTSGRDRHLEIRPERWTQTVRAGDFNSGRVFFRLPFRTVRPDRSSDWWSRGVLQIRLTVPGSGVIERTLSDLRLRHAEPMRDAWEQHTGRRSFPGENVQRRAWAGR